MKLRTFEELKEQAHKFIKNYTRKKLQQRHDSLVKWTNHTKWELSLISLGMQKDSKAQEEIKETLEKKMWRKHNESECNML